MSSSVTQPNRDELARLLEAAGVDGIMSDYPDRLLDSLKK